MPKLVSVLRKRATVGKNANKLAHPYYRRQTGDYLPLNIEMIPTNVLI